MATPIVSFIISVYNGEQFLRECIAGINGQTFSNYECIVVDDGSSDRTPDILNEWAKSNDRVCVLTRQNNGLTSALNLAISRARGEYLARHDADDISSSYRIEKQVNLLETHKNVILAGTHSVEFENTESVIAVNEPPDDPAFMRNILYKGENPFVHGSIMMRKDAFQKLSEGYRFRYCQDYDLYLRISHLGNLRIIPNVLYGLRNHSSRTAIKSRALKGPIRMLIMRVNGLISWDSESEAIIANHGNNEPLWRILEQRIINNTIATSDDRMKAQYFMSMIGDNLEKGKRISTVICAIKAIGACPMWWKTWLSLPYAAVGMAIPRRMVGRWRGRSMISRYRKPCYATSLNEVFSKMQ